MANSADDAFLRWQKNQPAQTKPTVTQTQPVQRAPYNNPFINTLPQWNGGQPVNYQRQTPAPYNNPYINTLPQWNGGKTVNYATLPVYGPQPPAQPAPPKLPILNSPVVQYVQGQEQKAATYAKLNPPDMSRLFYAAGLLARNAARAYMPPVYPQPAYSGGGYTDYGGRGGGGGGGYTPAMPSWYTDMLTWRI